MAIILLVLSGFSIDSTRNMLTLSSIIASFALMMICYSTINIPVNRYFFFLVTTFFMIGLSNLIIFMPIKSYILFDYDFSWFAYIFSKAVKTVILCLNTYIISSDNESDAHQRYWHIIIVTLIFSLAINMLTNNFLINTFIAVIIQVIILIIAIVLYKDLKFIKDKSLNYMSAYRFYLLISKLIIIFGILVYKTPKPSIVLEYSNFLFSIFFIICMLEKILNNSYKVLFKDINYRNIQLENINKEIRLSTIEIEEAERKLYSKHDMFENIFKHIPIPIVILNLNNGRIIFSNDSFLSMFKKNDYKFFINKPILNLIKFKDEDKDELIYSNINFLKTYEAEVFIEDKKRSLEVQFLEVIKENEECIMTISDITERLEVHEIQNNMENKRTQEKIRSDFLSNISHDLKVPINVIYSAMQLEELLVKSNNYKEVKKYTGMARENCMGLITLTNNLIDSSRLSFDFLEPNLSKCNIVEAIEDITSKLVEYLKINKLELIFDTDEEEVYMNLDIRFLERIVLNLISNSIKYTKDGGMIFVNIYNHEDFCEVIFKDSGIGMDKEFIKQAFNRYSIGNNEKFARRKGTGIGLFVVKNLVELQNGTVEIESEVGEGTTIILKFYREKRNNEYII